MKFAQYMGKVGAGYGPDFVIDASDLMLIKTKNTAPIIVQGGKDELRETFAQLANIIPIQPYQPERADYDIAREIDRFGSASFQVLEDMPADDKATKVNKVVHTNNANNANNAVNVTNASAIALLSSVEPVEEIAAAAVVTSVYAHDNIDRDAPLDEPVHMDNAATDTSALVDPPEADVDTTHTLNITAAFQHDATNDIMSAFA